MSLLSHKLIERRERNIPQGPFNTTPVFIKEDRGACMTDVDGKIYIDFAGGIGVNNVGHSHPKVVKSITDQARNFIHTCFHVAMYEPYVELAEKLNALAPVHLDNLDKDLERTANHIKDNVRRYNLREGLTIKDDTLPSRFFDQDLPDGKGITRDELKQLVSDYYKLRGWDGKGIPTDEKGRNS